MLTVVPLMQGDLLLPHCGIRAGTRGRLRRQVNYVVHCAASIIFNQQVHTLLANNYQVNLSSYVLTAVVFSALDCWGHSRSNRIASSMLVCCRQPGI